VRFTDFRADPRMIQLQHALARGKPGGTTEVEGLGQFRWQEVVSLVGDRSISGDRDLQRGKASAWNRKFGSGFARDCVHAESRLGVGKNASAQPLLDAVGETVLTSGRRNISCIWGAAARAFGVFSGRAQKV
jgi:hypothetical protein